MRYRYDEASCTRIKTAEIIVDKAPWTPPARKFANSDLVPVRIAYTEEALKQAAKAAKGRWNPDVKMWFIRYGNIKGMALEKHIVLDAFPKGQKEQKHIILAILEASNIICLFIILYAGI